MAAIDPKAGVLTLIGRRKEHLLRIIMCFSLNTQFDLTWNVINKHSEDSVMLLCEYCEIKSS